MLDNEEQKFLNIIKSFFDKDIVLFDVGTRDGQYIDLFLSMFSDKNIITHIFEPNDTNYNPLINKYNNTKNVVFNKLALDNEITVKTFYAVESSLEISGLSSLHYRKEPFDKLSIKQLQVQTNTLDIYCKERNIEKINFLKIDTEGNELNILKGGKELLSNKKIDFIQFEYGLCWKDSNSTISECLNLLNNFGYKIYSYFSKLEEITSHEETYEINICTNFLATYKELK
jgi:FkbM family methyltransferase